MLCAELCERYWILFYYDAVNLADHGAYCVLRDCTESLWHEDFLLDTKPGRFACEADAIDIQAQLVFFAVLQEVVLCLIILGICSYLQYLIDQVKFGTDFNLAKLAKLVEFAI